jgi:hypothetical protein
MSDLRDAARQALEFIKVTNARSEFWLVPESNLNKTVKALRTALEQPEQEPFAWMSIGGTIWKHKGRDDDVPLYSHPPRREWRGLTEEEKLQILDDTMEGGDLMDIARAIEQALKERNHE